jgi:hypothetical protein
MTVVTVVYKKLLANERSVLKGLEHEVLSARQENSAPFRPMWTSRTDAHKRFVMLCPFANEKRVLFEWPSSQIATLSPQVLRSRLEENLKQP